MADGEPDPAAEAPSVAAAVTDAPPAPAAPSTVKVAVVDNSFAPAQITVTAGTNVTWVNTGQAPHTVNAPDGSIDSGLILPGQSFSRTFDAPREYLYFCAPHVFIGMTGKVVVLTPPTSDGG
jgi:plastocyanin